MSEPVCGRVGCEKPLPEVAVRHGDPFCSSACARIEFGDLTAEQAAVEATLSRRGGEGADAGWRLKASVAYENAYGKKPRRRG